VAILKRHIQDSEFRNTVLEIFLRFGGADTRNAVCPVRKLCLNRHPGKREKAFRPQVARYRIDIGMVDIEFFVKREELPLDTGQKRRVQNLEAKNIDATVFIKQDFPFAPGGIGQGAQLFEAGGKLAEQAFRAMGIDDRVKMIYSKKNTFFVVDEPDVDLVINVVDVEEKTFKS
jgi:hypothetical protein